MNENELTIVLWYNNVKNNTLLHDCTENYIVVMAYHVSIENTFHGMSINASYSSYVVIILHRIFVLFPDFLKV